jgi:hypothetical protein
MKMEITGVKMPDKKFKLSDKFVEKYQKIKPPFGFNGLPIPASRATVTMSNGGKLSAAWWKEPTECNRLT